jgi:hypothetical protein|tara:strand:- start:115 stop:489 length:375 start_codon:yes stop_codon:yes gene_type:complete
MTIKFIVLKSGEQLISDIKEMAVGEEDDQKVVGYFLHRPCIVKMKNPGVIDQEKGKTKAGFEVTLIPWLSLTQDEVIPIPSDWLVTLVEPVPQLTQMYTEDVLNYGQDNQSDSADEQPGIGITN